MKKFRTKDNRPVLIALTSDDNVRYIKALESTTHNEIGYLNFKLLNGNKAYLWSIKVTDDKYLQCGVGSIMLKCFEAYCKARRVEYIEGRYYPDGKGGKYAEDFYGNHDYSIVREGYEQYLFKPLYRSKLEDKYLIKEEVITTPSNDGNYM